ncbi:MAG TPA: protein phosphatase 2C domain-containing protein [Gemmataceae bacterium]|nr:protein phosphatase 2C domain-containing protein [Gemmataceae bacterium]
MGSLQVRAGGHSAQGLRPNNEDRFLADTTHAVFLVADGMGGQESGEQASGLAVEIIPRAIQVHLDSHGDPSQAVTRALREANQAILDAGKHQAIGRRMGTTAVLAVRQDDQIYVAGLGDSRAYLIRGDRVEQLTIDHTIAEALLRNGALTPEQARQSPYRHVLYKFLGCADLPDSAEVHPFTPQPGDRLVLASDGLTNYVAPDDLRTGAIRHPDPQEWANELVLLALERGSNDNVTCVVVAFS